MDVYTPQSYGIWMYLIGVWTKSRHWKTEPFWKDFQTSLWNSAWKVQQKIQILGTEKMLKNYTSPTKYTNLSISVQPDWNHHVSITFPRCSQHKFLDVWTPSWPLSDSELIRHPHQPPSKVHFRPRSTWGHCTQWENSVHLWHQNRGLVWYGHPSHNGKPDTHIYNSLWIDDHPLIWAFYQVLTNAWRKRENADFGEGHCCLMTCLKLKRETSIQQKWEHAVPTKSMFFFSLIYIDVPKTGTRC